MQTITEGYRSFTLLITINWDRLMYALAIIGALFLGSFFGSLMIEAMTHQFRY